MRKAILILIGLVLATSFSIVPAQRRKAAKTSKPPSVSPCGVPIPRYDDWLEETRIEWRELNDDAKTTSYYNTKKQVCEKSILKIWIKVVTKESLNYRVDRLEVNCRSNQTRLTSSVDYRQDG